MWQTFVPAEDNAILKDDIRQEKVFSENAQNKVLFSRSHFFGAQGLVAKGTVDSS